MLCEVLLGSTDRSWTYYLAPSPLNSGVLEFQVYTITHSLNTAISKLSTLDNLGQSYLNTVPMAFLYALFLFLQSPKQTIHNQDSITELNSSENDYTTSFQQCVQLVSSKHTRNEIYDIPHWAKFSVWKHCVCVCTHSCMISHTGPRSHKEWN